jgi:hypothetical protein
MNNNIGLYNLTTVLPTKLPMREFIPFIRSFGLFPDNQSDNWLPSQLEPVFSIKLIIISHRFHGIDTLNAVGHIIIFNVLSLKRI